MFENKYIEKYYKDIIKNIEKQHKENCKQYSNIKQIEKAEKQYKEKLESIKNELMEIDKADAPIMLQWGIEHTKNGQCKAKLLFFGEYVAESTSKGWGYDKKSSVIAECLNTNKGIKKLLIKNRNKRLCGVYYSLNSDNVFINTGGLGMSTIFDILTAIGYTKIYFNGLLDNFEAEGYKLK